jgi:hypothetical protein
MHSGSGAGRSRRSPGTSAETERRSGPISTGSGPPASESALHQTRSSRSASTWRPGSSTIRTCGPHGIDQPAGGSRFLTVSDFAARRVTGPDAHLLGRISDRARCTGEWLAWSFCPWAQAGRRSSTWPMSTDSGSGIGRPSAARLSTCRAMASLARWPRSMASLTSCSASCSAPSWVDAATLSSDGHPARFVGMPVLAVVREAKTTKLPRQAAAAGPGGLDGLVNVAGVEPRA